MQRVGSSRRCEDASCEGSLVAVVFFDRSEKGSVSAELLSDGDVSTCAQLITAEIPREDFKILVIKRKKKTAKTPKELSTQSECMIIPLKVGHCACTYTLSVSYCESYCFQLG